MKFEKPPSIEPPVAEENEKADSGSRITRFFEKTGFLELRKDPEAFEAWFQQLSFDDAQAYLSRINGILREKPLHDRSEDGERVEVGFGIMGDTAYLPPPAERKAELMQYAFEGAKKVSDRHDRANLAYYAIQAIHPYLDGNGRTGRLVHELLDEGDLDAEQVAAMVDHEGEGAASTGAGRSAFAKKVMDPSSAYYYVNRELARKELGDDFSERYGRIYVAAQSGTGLVGREGLTPEEHRLAEKALGEADVPNFAFRDLVLAKVLEKKSDPDQYRYQMSIKVNERNGVVADDIGKEIYAIEGEELMNSMDADEVRDALAISAELKTEFVRDLVDVFVEPQSHMALVTEGEDPMPVKDVITAREDSEQRA